MFTKVCAGLRELLLAAATVVAIPSQSVRGPLVKYCKRRPLFIIEYPWIGVEGNAKETHIISIAPSLDARLFHPAESIRRQSIKKPTQSFKQPLCSQNINNANLFLFSIANRIILFISTICLAVTQLLSHTHTPYTSFPFTQFSWKNLCSKVCSCSACNARRA